MMPIGGILTRTLTTSRVVASLVLILTYAVARRATLATLVILLLALAAVAGILKHRPSVGVAIAAASVALVPIYWGRTLGEAVPLIPVVAAGAYLLPAAASVRHRLRPVWIDYAVATYVGLVTLSMFLHFAVGLGLAATSFVRIVLPYAVMRILCVESSVRRAFAGSMVAAGAALSVVAASEPRTGSNVFFSLVRPGFQASQWARSEMRFGSIRAEASFGHPIAFGLFLALAILVSFALFATAKGALARTTLAVSVVFMFSALLATLSRGPLVVLAMSLAVWLLTSLPRLRRSRLWLLSIVAVGFIAFGPVGPVLEKLAASTQGQSEAAQSARHRVQILELLRDPEQFSWLGKSARTAPTAVAEEVASRTGFRSIDNEFARIYVTNGLLALVAFTVIGALLWKSALSPGLDVVGRAFAVGSATALVGCSIVALLTQYADLFWMALATVAGAEQARSSRLHPEPTSTIDDSRRQELPIPN